ncbi:MAG TPA: alpha-ketoacid dehydrogenase subunit beta [Actinomycetota bacterium]|nr:alpha-ketoacid dehydrogenase subunit beta [Actinomycetota bacterium]
MATQTERLLTTAKAISEAIAQEMERDPTVFVMGEDVGVYGGIFGATEGLLARFGPERVMDTPISETGFIGAAVGAALSGMRPIVELMFVDFFGVCMDQIYNHMAKIHYFSGGRLKVPVVLTTATGGGYSDGGQHSQTLHGTFAHLPGLKVVLPSTPYDAKGLMISAIRDDNPVLYMFHKGLMGLGWMTPNPRATGPVPEEPYTVPIGVADVKREGSDLTIVAVSLMVHRALDAAEQLAAEGIEAEVLDLRSLVPLDREAILRSVRKTHRLLVVDEDYQSFGMSGEVITTAVEGAFDHLDAPPARVAYPDVPIPYSRPLEQFCLPNAEKIAQAARRLLGK